LKRLNGESGRKLHQQHVSCPVKNLPLLRHAPQGRQIPPKIFAQLGGGACESQLKAGLVLTDVIAHKALAH
jgi:hypothetical protein